MLDGPNERLSEFSFYAAIDLANVSATERFEMVLARRDFSGNINNLLSRISRILEKSLEFSGGGGTQELKLST